jgi:branched-chain amino acid transport system substrate-binding protein
VSVSPGTINIAFGRGSVWTTNFITGTSSLISPATNAVALTRSLAGTPQGIAVAGGTVWVSVAGGARQGSLPPSACGPVQSGGRRPDVLVASDLPLQGTSVTRTIADAIRLVMAQHGFRAGKYTVGYQSCDDSTAQVGNFDFFKCGTNAKAYAEAAQLVAVIGPYNSGCARVEIPIVNRAASGPVPMISPSTTFTGLTRTQPSAGATASYVRSLYPSGVRNFVRVVGPDDLQGAGQALLARELGVRRIYVLDDGYPPGQGLASSVLAAAPKLGLVIAGSGEWGPSSNGYPALAARVASSHPDAVLLGGGGPADVVKALRERLGPRVALIAGDGFLPISELLQAAGPAALGMYISIAGTTSEALPPAGRRFMQELAATQPGGTIPGGTTYVPEAVQAAEVTLAAIARSTGTRSSVLGQLRATRVRNGILGSFGFDTNGDMTQAPVSFFRVTGGAGGPGLLSDYRGSVAFRIIYVPASLVR